MWQLHQPLLPRSLLTRLFLSANTRSPSRANQRTLCITNYICYYYYSHPLSQGPRHEVATVSVTVQICSLPWDIYLCTVRVAS